MNDHYVLDQIATHLDSLFDDENGYYFGAYVEDGKVWLRVTDADDHDRSAYYTLELMDA